MKIPAPCSLLLRVNDLYARRRGEVEDIRRRGPALISGEIEDRAIAFAIGVLQLLDEMRRADDGQRHVADCARSAARLQSHHRRSAATRFIDDKQTLARRRIADEQ